jgi:peptidyl-prolyl cis-trans isomerase D
MFDFIRQHSRVMFFVLVLLIIPSFVFFGMEGYTGMRDQANTRIAEVDGQPITQGQWDAAHREQTQRIMSQMPNVDAKLLDSPEMRGRVLEGLIRERVLSAAAAKLHLDVSDARLKRIFSSDPGFAQLRNPDGTVNKDILAMQGMNSEVFAARLKQDLSRQQVLQALQTSVPTTLLTAETALNAYFQQREIQVLTFEGKDFSSKVSPTDADLQAYYKSPTHAAEFKAAEFADIEYLQLDLDTLMKAATPSAEDLLKFYKENQSRYSTAEERRASHILLKLDAKASKEDVEKVRSRAQALMEQARKDPKQFAELARKNSDDPGSAANGGDLDFFGRGAMVKPFEDESFRLKVGEISQPVRSDFGFHVILLTAVRGGEVRPIEAVKSEIEDELRRQAARKRYMELAGEFTNAVYEQADSLQPVAQKFGLELRRATGVTRTPQPGAQGPLGSAKFLEALFTAESVSSKRNIDALEIGPSQLVSGRIVKHMPERVLPLAEVKEQVRARVAQEQAQALARKDGEARLAALKADKAAALEAPILQVSRVQPKDLPPAVLDAALGVAPAQLPAWLGVNLPTRGYAVVRVNKIVGRDPLIGDLSQGRQQYAMAWADAESQAYYEALKSRLKVKVQATAAQSALDAAASAAR